MDKRAIWLAVNSAHGDRLVQIAQEHCRLAREVAANEYLSHQDKETYKARIEQLRRERDQILTQFEEEVSTDGQDLETATDGSADGELRA